MSARRLFLDRGIAEIRGVVTLDDRPERLIVRRDHDEPRLMLGARSAARVVELAPAISTAFLDLGGGAQAMLPFKPDARPVQGQMIAVEIRAEARRGKLAVARWAGTAEGEPRLLGEPPDLAEVLRGFAKGAEIVHGREAREAADEAETEALAVVHALPGGGNLAVEPTRALTAIDVDVGDRKGADAKRVARHTNLAALSHAARLLRLKGLGGLVVMDLAGRGHDGQALLNAARAAFAPDNPGVAIGPVGRFGTLEMSLPRRIRPLREILCDEDGRLNELSLALRLVRRLQAEGEAQPGARLRAVCAPQVAAVARPMLEMLARRQGSRFRVEPEADFHRDRIEIGIE